jgi:hypothetical protein
LRALRNRVNTLSGTVKQGGNRESHERTCVSGELVRMTRPTARNAGLAALLDEADWSRTQCALAVNRAGHEAGMALHYDQSAVSH